MDQDRFDTLTRTLAMRGGTRREVAAIVAGAMAGVGSAGMAIPPVITDARKSGKGRKKCKKGRVKCGKVCVDTQTNAQHCGGCGRHCDGNTACVNGTCQGGGCASSQIRCGSLCVDPQTDSNHCGACGNACGSGIACAGGQCASTGCAANEIDCGGGLCISDHEHACCSQADCGGAAATNDIACNTSSHRCECTQAGWGICQRFTSGTGLCGRCCPGAILAIGDLCLGPNDDLICVSQTFSGCTCPPGKPLSCNSPGFGVRCRADGNDPRACGGSCQTCSDSECCINGQCVNRMGCGPGEGGSACAFGPCGGCDGASVCQSPTALCCRVGPAQTPTCVSGVVCP